MWLVNAHNPIFYGSNLMLIHFILWPPCLLPIILTDRRSCMPSLHHILFEHNELKLEVEVLLIEQSILYRVIFNSSRPPLVITKAKD